MDSATEKNCLEELTVKLIEENEKISQQSISNLYMVHYDEARRLLNKLLDLHKGTITLVKEFWTSGWSNKLEYSMLVVSEDRKIELEKLWSSFSANLYSLATETCAKGKSYRAHDGGQIKMKAITVDVGHRVVEYRATVEEPVVKLEIQSAKSVKSMFNSAPKAVDKKPKVEKKVDDKSPPSIKSDEIKSQSTTPKVSSPAVVKKTPGAKAKGNIASFFNSRPAASTSKKMESIPRTEKTPDRETETMKIESSDEDVKKTPARKNGAVKIESSDEDVKKSTDVPKQQIKKKTKLKVKKTKSNKRSRIMQMEDSSDEEKDDDKDEEPEAKLIKFDREVTPESDAATDQAVKEKEDEQPSRKIRSKAKRTVCRTYEDEDGFINTVREIEEYSTSEAEDVTMAPVAKENEKPNKEPVKEVKTKESPVAVKNRKQGSIMSFFTKK